MNTLDMGWIAVHQISNEEHLSLDDIRGKSRRARLVAVRRRIARHLRDHSNLRLCDIARILGKDHSTVINYLKGEGWIN
jgi:chromosomal replication initiation ATPase DnaA